MTLKICGEAIEQLFLFGPIGPVHTNLTILTKNDELTVSVQCGTDRAFVAFFAPGGE